MIATMHCLRIASGFATFAIAFATGAPRATAQEMTFTSTCSQVGVATPEPVGDREGHTIMSEEDVCRFDSGPFAGGVMTSTGIWEWDKTNAILISSGAVFRKPGATAVGRLTEGKIALTIVGGKVSGAVSSVRGSWPIATGNAASLAGKLFTATATDLGPGQFLLEYKVEQ
jgi:hypothetical protein